MWLNMLFDKRKRPKNIVITMTRESLNMGDDCMAPHEEKAEFVITDTLDDLLQRVAEYPPFMHNYRWEVKCGKETIGRLISDNVNSYTAELCVANTKISALPEHRIHCRIRRDTL